MISFIHKLLEFYHKVTYSDRADQWLRGAPLVRGDKEGQEGESKKRYWTPFAGNGYAHKVNYGMVSTAVYQCQTLSNCILLIFYTVDLFKRMHVVY